MGAGEAIRQLVLQAHVGNYVPYACTYEVDARKLPLSSICQATLNLDQHRLVSESSFLGCDQHIMSGFGVGV